MQFSPNNRSIPIRSFLIFQTTLSNCCQLFASKTRQSSCRSHKRYTAHGITCPRVNYPVGKGEGTPSWPASEGGTPSWPSQGYPPSHDLGTPAWVWVPPPGTGIPLGRDLGPVTEIPHLKDMGPIEVSWDGDGVAPPPDLNRHAHLWNITSLRTMSADDTWQQTNCYLSATVRCEQVTREQTPLEMFYITAVLLQLDNFMIANIKIP